MLLSLLWLFFQAAPSLDPPEGQKLILTAQARGVQVYTCESSGENNFQWVFDRAEAELIDEKGQNIGRHFAGPSWESYDASRVTGKVVARRASPDPNSIPWMLFSAESHSGTPYGAFAHVEYIQRLNTKGGIAPATGCDAAHLRAKSRVPYSATYQFFRPQ
jgi:hypothetical protein